uniref:EGF-like domain-containing protein n=1 Tax=Crocodylus porosus TaxID=8502 RepID=A0A7M4F227_CROPO
MCSCKGTNSSGTNLCCFFVPCHIPLPVHFSAQEIVLRKGPSTLTCCPGVAGAQLNKHIHINFTLSFFRCTCTAGWTGSQCNEDINECDSDPCLNGGTCYESVVQGQFICLCPPFYTGDSCQQRYNPCDPHYNPCINNSTCLAQADASATLFARCSCQHGFSGSQCEVDINECSSRPCKNNATCLDLINRFSCNCTPGYYGSLCELDIDECEVLPCLHGGSCLNKLGGYLCLCLPGFTGIIHSLNVNLFSQGRWLSPLFCIFELLHKQRHSSMPRGVYLTNKKQWLLNSAKKIYLLNPILFLSAHPCNLSRSDWCCTEIFLKSLWYSFNYSAYISMSNMNAYYFGRI